MSDDLDLASDREYLARHFAQSIRKPEGPAATGFCLYCEDFVVAPLRWCNADCRDDWQLRSKQPRPRA